MTESVHRPSRRSFLDILLGTSAVAWVASIAYPVLRYLKPLPAAGAGGPVHLSAEELGKLEREKMLILRVGAARVLVFLDQTEKVRAMSARCTHEGCTVKFVPGESLIWCACHNARFDVEGRVLGGPAPKPLPQFIAQRTADGGVVVTVEGA